jgi:hypothetical protein
MRQEVNPASGKLEIPYSAPPVFREEHAEGRVTRLLEQQVAKLPSAAFLSASLAALCASLGLELASRTRTSRFVGMWVAPLLSMGIYVKLVKTLGAR